MSHPSSAENVRLFVDPDFTRPTLMERYAIVGHVDASQAEADIASRQQLVQDARALGITVVSAAAGKVEGAHDYLARGDYIDSQQEAAELKELVPNILLPTTVSFQKFDDSPFFPALAKAIGLQEGAHKYLLEDHKQWKKFRTFLTGEEPLRTISEEDRSGYERALADAARYASGTPEAEASRQHVEEWRSWIEHVERPFRQTFTRHFEYQQFIETPSDRYTSYRVLISASGSILASSLYYSAYTKDNAPVISTNRDLMRMGFTGDVAYDFLTTPGSLVYLGAKNVLSNNSQGGSGIVLNPTEASKKTTNEEKRILAAHGIDPENPRLPEAIRKQSQIIATTVGKRQGVIMGMDWLQEAETGNYYYIENNSSPGPVAFADAHFGGLDRIDRNQARVAMNRMALKSLIARAI